MLSKFYQVYDYRLLRIHISKLWIFFFKLVRYHQYSMDRSWMNASQVSMKRNLWVLPICSRTHHLCEREILLSLCLLFESNTLVFRWNTWSLAYLQYVRSYINWTLAWRSIRQSYNITNIRICGRMNGWSFRGHGT